MDLRYTHLWEVTNLSGTGLWISFKNHTSSIFLVGTPDQARRYYWKKCINAAMKSLTWKNLLIIRARLSVPWERIPSLRRKCLKTCWQPNYIIKQRLGLKMKVSGLAGFLFLIRSGIL